MIQGMEHSQSKDRLRALELFSLEKRAQERCDSSLTVSKGGYKKDGDGLCSRVCCDRTRGNGFKLKEGRSLLDLRKKFFTVRVVRH